MNGGQGAWIPQTWATCSLLNLPPYHPEQCFSKCLPGPPAAAAAGAAPERLFEMQIQTYWSLGVGPTVWPPRPSRWLWCLFLGKRRLSVSSESPAPQKNNQGATAHTPSPHVLIAGWRAKRAREKHRPALCPERACWLPAGSALQRSQDQAACEPVSYWVLVSVKRTGSWVGPKGVQSLSLPVTSWIT